MDLRKSSHGFIAELHGSDGTVVRLVNEIESVLGL